MKWLGRKAVDMAVNRTFNGNCLCQVVCSFSFTDQSIPQAANIAWNNNPELCIPSTVIERRAHQAGFYHNVLLEDNFVRLSLSISWSAIVL